MGAGREAILVQLRDHIDTDDPHIAPIRYFSNMILNIANILTTLILGYWQNLPNILPYNSIRSVWRAPYTLFTNTLLCSPVSNQPPELVRGHTHMGASKITVKSIRTHYYTARENTTQNCSQVRVSKTL